MAFSLTTHERIKVPNTAKTVIGKIKPYIRLKYPDGPPVFIQEGRVYYENGQQVTNVPPWFDEAISKITQAALKSVSFDLDSYKKKTEEKVKAKREKVEKRRGRPPKVAENGDNQS